MRWRISDWRRMCCRTRQNVTIVIPAAIFLFGFCSVLYMLAQTELIHERRRHSETNRVKKQIPLLCDHEVAPHVYQKLFPKDGHFKKVQNSDLYIYSAYFDDRDGDTKIIRVMGVAAEGVGSLYCQLHYASGHVISVPATLSVFSIMLPEMHKGFSFKPYFVYCQEYSNQIPKAVSLSQTPCSQTGDVIPVQYTPVPETSLTNGVLVCMKTVFGPLIPQRIVEFMEWQTILGADKVILYDTEDVSDLMKRTLKHYVNTGLLEIQSYKPPLNSTLIRDRGQLIQVNDCMYRNMYRYKYIAFLDPDELIIPRSRKPKTYTDLVKSLNLFNPNAAGYRFANVIFCLKPHEENRVPPDLLSIRKVIRSDFFPYQTWTKVLVNPRRVVELGIHRIEKAVPGYVAPVLIPPSIALLQHYRKYDFRFCGYTDKTALNYQTDIVKKYISKIKLLSLH